MKLFFEPIDVSGIWLWLLLPLCLTVALVYKTTKMQDLKRLPASVAGLWATTISAVLLIGGVLYLLVYLWVDRG